MKTSCAISLKSEMKRDAFNGAIHGEPLKINPRIIHKLKINSFYASLRYASDLTVCQVFGGKNEREAIVG